MIYKLKIYQLLNMKKQDPKYTGPQQCFHIFYTKDLHKKKKIYKEGVLTVSGKTAKIYDEDGQLVCSFKNKEEVVVNEEYTVNNSYALSVDKVGIIEDFNTGAIFTKKQIVLPIKKKPTQAVASKSYKQQEQVQLKCGLNIETKLYDVLRPHQIQGVQFMYECVSGKKDSALSGCILADFMGLGKTLQTLVLAYSMVKQKDIKKFVIVCPLTLLNIWQKQTKKWLQDKMTPLVCYGDGTETTNVVKKFVTYQYRMLIISYETFYKNIDLLSGKCDLVIFDQGHRMKNKKSKLLLKIKVFKCDKRILLTGTPIQNNLQELYTCISVINPRIFGSQPIFKNVFQKPILQGLAKKATKQQKELAKQRTAQLARQLKQFSLRRTADVLKKFLPTKTEHLIFLKLTPLQHTWYQRLVLEKSQKQQDIFKTLNNLRKLFIHPSLLKMKKITDGNYSICSEDCGEEKSYKIQFTVDIVLDCVRKREKCVVVSYFTETLDFVGDVLRKLGVVVVKLDGRQSVDERKNSLLKFEKEVPVLLLSGKAGGTGLTLVCAVKMIMIQPDWNPSNDSQVMGRIWRQGQQNKVQIYRLIIASTFEQKILMRQKLKKTLSNNLIDNGEQYENVDMENIGKLFVDNKNEVLSYKPNQNQIEHFFIQHSSSCQEYSKNGVIFIRSLGSSDSECEGLETDCAKEVSGDVCNQFDIDIEGFGKDGDEDTDFDVEGNQDQSIGNIQKITISQKNSIISQKGAISTLQVLKQDDYQHRTEETSQEAPQQTNNEKKTSKNNQGQKTGHSREQMTQKRDQMNTITSMKTKTSMNMSINMNINRSINKAQNEQKKNRTQQVLEQQRQIERQIQKQVVVKIKNKPEHIKIGGAGCNLLKKIIKK